VDKDTPQAPWWYDHVASQARAFRLAGFTAVLLPPVLKTNAGAFPGADGYGVFDDYDLGSKNQFFSIATRFGTREQLQRCVAILRANGLDVYVDTVPHQRMGGNNGVYRYLGADGRTPNGRFPKNPGCFVGKPPRVPRDPIAGPVSTDFGFGDELAPINAVPKGYVMQGLIDAGDWMTRALGVQGYRVDDVKGMAVPFVREWLTAKAMADKFAVGEYYDGDANTVNWWIWQSGMGGRSAAFDFPLHFTLQAMCNSAGRWNMAQLDHAGLAGISPMQAVTFVENPDTDTDGFAAIVDNKMLAYAYILMSEGYPCVYYRDYSADPNCYGLKPWIDNLIWIHENLAFGETVQRWKDFQCFAFERLGYPNLLAGLHNDADNGWKTITVQTAFGPHVQLHDYSGHAGDVWTDGSGMVTIGIPPNHNGLGYVCYSRTGYAQPFSVKRQAVTQVFEGAEDLDIGPAAEGRIVQVCRCWCAAGTTIEATLRPAMAGWTAQTEMLLEVVRPTGAVAASQGWSGTSAHPGTLRAAADADGWYTAQLSATHLPAVSAPYELTVSYTAPGELPTS
jgi:alpha-amylase